MTTGLFWFLLSVLVGLPIAVVSDLDSTNWWSGTVFGFGVLAYVLSAVVWSDLPWPGDPA